MNISITFRQMDATDAVRGYATEKISNLPHFLLHPLHVHVTVSFQNIIHMVEVDLHSGGQHYHAHESSEDMYATIDKVIDKLERQIRDGHGTSTQKGAERASDHLLPDPSEE